MQYRAILVTGGAGFVGSNIAVSLKDAHPSAKVIALDNLKRRGSELNVRRLKGKGVEFVHGDIRNPEDLRLDTQIDLLIECSAEPSVMAGYNESPAYLINTNLLGTVNCLELARNAHADVVFLSTSRVYPYDAVNALKAVETDTRFVWSREQGREVPGWSPGGISTAFTLNGRKSMYGATKLCSEIILQEYLAMYGIRGIINRCGVIAGPWQFGKVDQGVFTLWLLAHYFRRDLSYIGFGGKGKQVRDVLHIDDLSALLQKQLSRMDELSGRVYNVGGGDFASLSLLEATRLAEDVTGNRIKITSNPETRPADVIIYMTDNAGVKQDCDWSPRKDAKTIFADICDWIRSNEKDIAGSLQ